MAAKRKFASKIKPASKSEKQTAMRPEPQTEKPEYEGSGKLDGKVAIVTGGDSGIGQATAVLLAREGADVAVVYLKEHGDAENTQELVENEGRRCLLASGDVGEPTFCEEAADVVMSEFGHIDILINNAAEQHPQKNFTDISQEQLERTFRTNIFGYFFMAQACLPHLKKGATIINTASVTAYKGHEILIDYASTKGAIVSFTRSLALNLAKKGIRVNAVAPGPIWTPLIPSTFGKDKVRDFGKDTPLGRPGQPEEVAPCYVFLASDDASYMTGQVLHPNGGEIVNG